MIALALRIAIGTAFGAAVAGVALASAAAARATPLYPGAHRATFAAPPYTDVYLVSAPLSTVVRWYRAHLHGVTREQHVGAAVAFHEPHADVSVSAYSGGTQTEIAIVRS